MLDGSVQWVVDVEAKRAAQDPEDAARGQYIRAPEVGSMQIHQYRSDRCY